MRALFKSINLLGDGLWTSRPLVAWHRCHLDYEIDVLTLPDYIAPIYRQFGVMVNVITDESLLRKPYNLEYNFDCSKAYAMCSASPGQSMHISEAYGEMLGVDIKRPDDGHLVPAYYPIMEELESWEKDLVLISMFSASCTSRDPNTPGLPPNKMLPWHKWEPILRYVRNHFQGKTVKFLGAPTDRAPRLDISEDEYMTGVPLNRLANIMAESRFIITLDNGMSHLAASQYAKMFLLYPEVLKWNYIAPRGNKNMCGAIINPVNTPEASIVKVLKEVTSKLQI